MITNFLLILVYNLINLILTPLRAFDNVTLPANIASSISTAGDYLSNLNAVFPISTLIYILATFLAIETGIFVYKGIQWLIKKIPTIN